MGVPCCVECCSCSYPGPGAQQAPRNSLLNECVRSKRIAENGHIGQSNANSEMRFRKHKARSFEAWLGRWPDGKRQLDEDRYSALVLSLCFLYQ